jgi:5-methylcytosine-specific restriction endonuclease McrA
MARQGKAGQGLAWPGKARRGTWPGLAGPGQAWQGTARQGKERGGAWLGKAGPGSAGHGRARFYDSNTHTLMPYRPARACTRSMNCPHVVTDAKPCPVHGRVAQDGAWAQPSSKAGQRLRGRAWMVIRHQILSEEACCYLCGGGGTSADEIDHVDGNPGNNDRANLRRCCQPCNKTKGQRESRRARWGR